MTPKQFSKFVTRDRGCVHCGELEAISPHHRLNRGMGGSKLRDKPANIIVLCSWINNALEADSEIAEAGRQLGWKLRSGEDPELTWFYHLALGEWRILDNSFSFGRKKEGKNGYYPAEAIARIQVYAGS